MEILLARNWETLRNLLKLLLEIYSHSQNKETNKSHTRHNAWKTHKSKLLFGAWIKENKKKNTNLYK